MKNIIYVEHQYFASATDVSIKLKNVVTKDKIYIPFVEVSAIVFIYSQSYFSQKFIQKCLDNNILIIHCNEKHTPIAILQTEYGYIHKNQRLQQQMTYSKKAKNRLWKKVVKQKILNQNLCLEAKGIILSGTSNLKHIANDTKLGDETNREALASKIYFKALFGEKFKRGNDDVINASLNYTYAVLRAIIRQNLVILGLEPSLGIHHKSSENPFNLSDDIIECFRPIADAFIFDQVVVNKYSNFTYELKRILPKVLTEQCIVNNKIYYIADAVRITCETLAKDIENNTSSNTRLPQMIEGGR